MRRFGSLLLVLVLATASLLAAAAYSTATIVNAADVTVTNTMNGLLALVPGSDPDGTAYVSGGRLFIDFDKGWDHGARQPQGLQPGSTYVWNDLFKAVNLSHNTIAFRVDLLASDGVSAFSHPDIHVWISCDGVAFVTDNVNTANVWTEGPYFNKFVDVTITVDTDAVLTYPADIDMIFRVTGNAV